MTAECRCWCGCGRNDPELDDATSSVVDCLRCLMDSHKRLPPDRTCPTCGASWDEPYRKLRRDATTRQLAHAYRLTEAATKL